MGEVDPQKLFEVCELFYSICGEGQEQGRPAVFVRHAKCNRECLYCDTRFSWKGGWKHTVEEVVDHVLELHRVSTGDHRGLVFLTGGEPTLNPHLENLVRALKRNECEVILQTNGTKALLNVFEMVDLLSVDVKGPSSGQCGDPELIQVIYDKFHGQLMGAYEFLQFKYVIGDDADLAHAKEMITRFPDVCSILQPLDAHTWDPGKYGSKLRWLCDVALTGKFPPKARIRVSSQLHKLVWGHERAR